MNKRETLKEIILKHLYSHWTKEYLEKIIVGTVEDQIESLLDKIEKINAKYDKD